MSDDYIVISKADAKKYLSIMEKNQLEFILRSIEISRELEDKKKIKYSITIME